MQIFPTGKKICFELKYEMNNGEFYTDVIDKKNFTVVSENYFSFNLRNLIPGNDYFIEIDSEKDNIK